MKNNEYLTVSDMTEIFGISKQAVYQWIKDKRLKFYQISNTKRIRPADLLEYLKNRGNSQVAMTGFKKDIEDHLRKKDEVEKYLSEAKDKTDWAVRGAKVRNYETGTGPKPW